MNLSFDLDSIRFIEFGVGRDHVGNQTFDAVPTNDSVQSILRDMVKATAKQLEQLSTDPRQYDPSEKFGSQEYLYLSIGDDLAETFRNLHEASQLEISVHALNDTNRIFSYFARFIDDTGQHLTALRRATQFKSLGKSKLLGFLSDALTIVQGPLFKLDNDFDLLVDSELVHILRPSGFEFAGKLQQAILAAAPRNVEVLRDEIPFVDLDSIEEYASQHPRAARYLASIRSQGWAKDIDKGALVKLCELRGIEILASNGKITVSNQHTLRFLEVLDRRMLEVELVADQPEYFKATSRERIDTQGTP